MDEQEGGQAGRRVSRTTQDNTVRSPRRRWVRGPRGCLTGVAVTVVSALIVWLASVIFDVPGIGDWFRSRFRPADHDIRYTAEHLDSGYDLVLPTGVDLNPDQKKTLRDWSVDSPGGTDVLRRLIADLRARGGANPNELLLRITLEGRRQQAINVDDIRPVNIRRRSPYEGTFLFIPPQEPGETVKMMFNFDELSPQARVAVDHGGDYRPGGLFFQKSTLKIEDAKEDALLIKSIATRWAVSFDIRIDYRLGGKSKHLIIQDHGRSFALSPMNCADHTRLDQDGQPTASGHASYEHIWKLKDDFQGIAQVRGPGRFKIGTPYC